MKKENLENGVDFSAVPVATKKAKKNGLSADLVMLWLLVNAKTFERAENGTTFKKGQISNYLDKWTDFKKEDENVKKMQDFREKHLLLKPKADVRWEDVLEGKTQLTEDLFKTYDPMDTSLTHNLQRLAKEGKLEKVDDGWLIKDADGLRMLTAEIPKFTNEATEENEG